MSNPIASPDVSVSHNRVIKSRIAGAILALITLALFGLANLPYQYVESEVEWVGYLEISDGGSYRAYQNYPIMAGWPLRYLIRYIDGDTVQDRLWLPGRLAVNVSLGILVTVAVYLFVQFRRRKLIQSSGSPRVRLIFDSGVALAILLVPGTLFWWQYRTTRYHRNIARDLQRVGSSALSCWLPDVYSDHLPVALKRSLSRLRQVHVYGVGQQAAGVITSVPTLAAFHGYAGKYDSKPLEQLLDNPHFCVLQLNRQDLSDSDLATIGKLPWLDQLHLARTNLNATQLSSLDHLPLRTLDVSFTEIELSQIGKPGWSSTLESLSLSRPADGLESALAIEDWPALKFLQIERQSRYLNDAVLSLRLVDLPMLERLHIDRVQKHDLVLRNVPRLNVIDEGVSDLRYVMDSDMLIPGLTWVRQLEVDGADSLTKLECFARDLERFSVRRVASLRKLSIGSFLTTLLGEVQPQQVDAERCRSWIEQLGASSVGPARLDLSFLPMAEEELTPLVGNERIRHLVLTGTGVSFPQVQQLAGMKSLESLVIPSTPLMNDDLAWLLDHFSNLRNLWVDVRDLSNFDLTGRKRLRDVRITPMGSLDEIRIADLPRLRTAIRITRSPKTLQIRNVPSLRGLAVEGPWPETAELQGLRDLEWFTGGGAGINDQVLTEVLRCDSMDRLTLAYPSVSGDALRRIGHLKELTFLALPGANVNDEVVQAWSGLTSLWEVNLDDTQISVDTIGWLSRMESLRRLSINRVPLNEAAAEALAELDQVSELYLAGVSISHANLRNLLRRGSLESLDLSGWEVDEDLVDILCEDGAHLRHLILRDNEVSETTFRRLLAAAPHVYLDMGGIPDFVDQPSLEELHRRASVLRREMNTGWRLMLRPRDDVYQAVATGYRDMETEEDRETSEVPSLPVTYMTYLKRQLFYP